MSFNQWLPQKLFTENGTPVYSDKRTKGTAYAEKLLEAFARLPPDEKGERPMLVPPPLPKWRSDR